MSMSPAESINLAVGVATLIVAIGGGAMLFFRLGKFAQRYEATEERVVKHEERLDALELRAARKDGQDGVTALSP